MSNNKEIAFGPIALTATLTTNILNGAVTSLSGPVGVTLTQPRIRIKQLHIFNKTSGAVTFTLYKGATGANAAGTELFVGQTVAANSGFDHYGIIPMESTDFLVGGASAGTSLTISGLLEIGF